MLVAVPSPPGSNAATVAAAGVDWVVAPDLLEDHALLAGKVQGRRTTVAGHAADAGAHFPRRWRHAGDVVGGSPRTSNPSTSWHVPGGDPADPLANGGAFGG